MNKMITPNVQTVSLAGVRISRRALERTWLAALVGLVLLLALINLPYAPHTWFDEGSHLHVPKTLVQHGVYADISSEGYRYYGPTIGVGPTVMLPIALVFKLFGVGLLQGRLVIVAYLLLAIAAFYALARRLHGSLAGLLALTLLLASRTFSYEGLIEYGRQVVGEVPGVAFLLLGTLAWLAALRHDHRPPTTDEAGSRSGTLWVDLGSSMPSSWLTVLAGLGFGMALVTKNQFVLIVPPALLLAGLLDWRYYRAGSWRLRLVPLVVACGCFGLWTLAQFQFLGPGSFVENMRQTRQAAGGSIFVFSLRATLRAGYYLLRPDLYGGLLIPSLVYAAWRARRRNAQGLAEALIVLIVGLWLAWYVGASLGWPRYAFPAVAFGALLVARMLADLIGRLWRGGATQRGLALAVAAYTALAVAAPLALSARGILRPDDSAQRMAAYLDEMVPRDAIVETWEPELGLLTDHRYHYPPIALLDTAVRHQWLGGPALVYDGLRDAPAYVVVGGFGGYTGVYAPDVLARDYVEQQHIGSYVLFKRK
jgi:4-amino-4-deoxy-L-arabinose transferase-like glycosyltransferase